MNPAPSSKWSDCQQQYWKIHVNLISILAHIGPRLNVSIRLDLFWFRTRMEVVYGREANPEHIRIAIELIDSLVKLRQAGCEPPHKNGKYV